MTETVQQGQPRPRPQINLEALAREIIALMKEELRREAERGAKPPGSR